MLGVAHESNHRGRFEGPHLGCAEVWNETDFRPSEGVIVFDARCQD